MFDIPTSQRAVIIGVFTAFIVIQLGYAVYSRRSMKKSAVDKYVDDFYTGGRGMGAVVVALIVAAGICGSGIFLAAPASAYKNGQAFLFGTVFSISMNLMVLGMIGKKTGIIARRGNIQSFLGLSYDRYEHNKIYCVLSGVILLVFFTMFAANTYAGGAKLFQAMTGQSYTTGLLIFTVIVLVTALMGGVKGVAGAIVFQGAIMTFAVLTFTVLGLRYGVQSAGSMENVYRSLIKTAPQYFDLSTSVSSWPVVVFFAISGGMLAYTMPQATMGTLVHKNTKSLHSAIKIGTIVVFIWIMGLTLLNPIVKYTFPDLGKYTDLGIPLLVIKTMPAWVAGLCLAGVSAAVQSSLNGMAVSLSSMVVNDIIFAFIPKASPEKMKKITLATTTAICILLLLLAWNPPAFLYEISIYSVSAIGVAFGMPVLLGYYWKRANAWGAIAAIVTGIPTYIYVFHLPGVPYNSGLVAGLVVSFIADVVVSLLTPKPMLGTIKRWFCASYYDKEGNLLQ